MNLEQLVENSRPFLAWLLEWHDGLPTLAWDEILQDVGGDAGRIAVLAVDVTRGFCSEGPLASERVGRIVEPITRVFRQAHEVGVRHFILPQDTHTENAVEFGSYPPHCKVGSEESQTVDELRNLPFSDQYLVLEKNSISSDIDTGLGEWLDRHPEVTTLIVTGDCTDLCVYQLAMYLRLRANARNLREVRVVVPLDTIDTFDLPVEAARRIGAMPHDADLLHLVFAHAMASNGVEIVKQVM
ncbi:MAG: cysteine hydrolase [Anaerolineaceae bacterium]|nr:cysteine hydrolase [Anaerolineaceae bacterium]